MNAWQAIHEAIDPKRVLRNLRGREEMRVGEEVIRATGITRDIMQATLDKLKELNRKDYEAEMNDEVQAYLDGQESEDFDPEFYLYERLFSHMSLYCPPFTYFGSYEADGSIGCWPYDWFALEELEDKGSVVRQEGETPNWQDQAVLARRSNFLMLLKPDGQKQCWDIRRTPFLVWQW